MHRRSAARLAGMAGGMALVALIASGHGEDARAGAGGCHEAPQLEGSGTEVALRGNCFVPLLLHVEPGANVTFTNEDGYDHVVWGGPNMPPYDAALKPGATATRTFVEPGVYPYYCNLHFAMTGVVIVGNGKFTDQPGSAGFVTSDSSSALALPAIRAQAPSADQPGLARPVSEAAGNPRERDMWPFLLGGTLAVAGLTAGTFIAVFGWRTRD